jgi:hypothetical protein
VVSGCIDDPSFSTISHVPVVPRYPLLELRWGTHEQIRLELGGDTVAVCLDLFQRYRRLPSRRHRRSPRADPALYPKQPRFGLAQHIRRLALGGQRGQAAGLAHCRRLESAAQPPFTATHLLDMLTERNHCTPPGEDTPALKCL